MRALLIKMLSLGWLAAAAAQLRPSGLPLGMMTPEGLVAVPVPPNSSAYYTILAVASPLALAIALTFLVLPTPAGRQVGTAGEAAALTMAHRGSQRSRGGI